MTIKLNKKDRNGRTLNFHLNFNILLDLSKGLTRTIRL